MGEFSVIPALCGAAVADRTIGRETQIQMIGILGLIEVPDMTGVAVGG